MTFDEQAKNWDNDIQKVERATIFANEIRTFIKPNERMNALEFGCGTGLQSYFLRNDFKTITLIDTSQGMLDVLEDRIKNKNISNFKPILFDLTNNDYQPESEKFDVIYTSMTMHHIIEIDNILQKFNSMLNPDGYLCISDLVKEDGSFHSEHPDFDGHKGFEKNEIENYFKNNGFKISYYKICFTIEKIVNNETKKYPVFLIIGKKI
jgi:ubiquinone/menaquinone biosynthesis C-methylase UbiE